MGYRNVIAIALLVFFTTGTASFASTATIGSIKVAPGGTRIEIQGDQPLTYLYRQMSGGSGIILDIAPGKVRGVAGEIPGAGHITGIWVKELQVEGIPVIRLVIGMEKDAAVNVRRDSADPGRLLVTFPSLAAPASAVPGDPPLTDLLEPQARPSTVPVEPQQQSAELTAIVSPPSIQKLPEPPVLPTPVHEPRVFPAPLPSVAPPGPAKVEGKLSSATARPVLESVIINRDSIELHVGSAFHQYDSFRLSSPERLVVDLPGAGTSLTSREITIGKFGVSKARIGVYADKLRVVFDADSKKGVPISVVQKTAKGLKITFASVGGKR